MCGHARSLFVITMALIFGENTQKGSVIEDKLEISGGK